LVSCVSTELAGHSPKHLFASLKEKQTFESLATPHNPLGNGTRSLHSFIIHFILSPFSSKTSTELNGHELTQMGVLSKISIK
jgi:hypothetical protein